MPLTASSRPSLGIIDLGAFGRLMARHLRPHFQLRAYDLALPPGSPDALEGVSLGSLAEAARCPFVVLAMPVSRLADTVRALGPHLRPGTLVLDVKSVKVVPAAIMLRGLPAHAGIVATHPLFGPQSARDGIKGLKVAVCPVRGDAGPRVAAFLRRALGLQVIMTMPDAHGRELAMVQGLTHLIAKVLVQMEPLPARMTTRSFDLVMQGVAMVRHDAPEVFEAIERSNPYAREVRRRFFDLASRLDAELEQGLPPCPGSPAAGLPRAPAKQGPDPTMTGQLAPPRVQRQSSHAPPSPDVPPQSHDADAPAQRPGALPPSAISQPPPSAR